MFLEKELKSYSASLQPSVSLSSSEFDAGESIPSRRSRNNTCHEIQNSKIMSDKIRLPWQHQVI